MKARWQSLAAHFAALQLREKALVAVALVAGTGFFAYVAWVEPAAQRLVALQKQIVQKKNEHAVLQPQVATLKGQLKDPDAANRAALADARAKLAEAENKLSQYGGTLVAPERVPRLLQSLLLRHSGLTLVSLRTLSPEPLIPPPAPTKEAKPAEPAVAAAPGGNIYKHGIEIRIAGNYQSLLAYVADLEQAPQKLLWGNLSLKVTAHPTSELILTVYTLSLNPTWLIV